MKPLWTQIWIFLFCWLTIRNPPYSNKHRMRATCQYHSSRWHENSGQLNLSVHERSCSCLIYKVKWSRSVVSNSLRPHGLVAHQAPQSMGFSRQEYWRGLPFPSPGCLSYSGIEPRSPALQADALPSERDPNDDSIHMPLIPMSLKKVLGRPSTQWKRQLWEKNWLLAPKEVQTLNSQNL